MNRRLLQTILVGAVLSGAYPAYSLATRQLLSSEVTSEPDRRPVAQNPDRDLTDRDTSSIVDQFLPDQPWAAQAGIQFRDDVNQFFYFAEDSSQTDTGTDVRFEPLALVWFGKDGGEPLTIVADAAVLTFENEIRLPDPDPGRILGAELIGNVSIRGENGVHVRGQHFIYAEKSGLIFSDNPVDFEYHEPGRKPGESVDVTGTASKGIEIRLDVAEAPDSDAMLAVEDIRELRLYQEVRVDFDVVQDGDRIPLDITSQGGFTLEFQDDPESSSEDDSQMVATFRERVRVYRRRTPEDFDVLACDRLRLFLERAEVGEAESTSSQSADVANADSNSTSLQPGRGVRFLWMSAVGDKVILHSVEKELTAVMKRLDHDPERQRTWLNDLRFDPRYQQADGEQLLQHPRVRVRRGTSEIECLQAELRHADEGGIGELICRGAGWLVHREPLDQSRADADADDRTEKPAERSVPSIKSEPTLTAQWQQQLRMYPDSKYGLDVIDLTGNVVVQIPENEAGIAADSVTVWMDSADQALSKPAQSKRAGSATPAVERQELSGGKSDSSNPLPRRLLADGNVRFSNPEITGNTDRLVAWFEQAPTRPARGPAAASGRAGERRWQMARFSSEAPLPPSRDLRLRPTSLRLFAEDTSASADAAPPLPVDAVRESDRDPRGETGSGDAPDEPVRVRSKLIQLRIVKYGDDPPEVAEFLTEGNVELRQTRKPGQPETVLTGEQLHVTNRSEQEQDIHVFGSPARLSDPALELSGDHLSLFRSQNLMVVDGPGALKLTVDRDFEGNVLETPEELTVQWVEQMSFDGQVAEFVGRVAASMKQSSMRCKQMTVTMTERMQFMDDEDVERPDVDRIVCRYQVEVDSHKVEDGVLMQVVRARFAQFALDQQTGRAEALGPGVVRRWGRGTGETAGLGPLAEVGANAGAEARRDGWEFTRIEFASRMIAQTEKKTMTFFGPVDVLYGPVDEPLESIDIDHLPRQGGLMSCDELDVLQRKLTNGQEYVELLAQGNATLEGRTFSAQSHEITYDGAKKLYTLRSRGDQHAVLVRKRRDGRRTRVVASAFRFIPSQDYFEVEKASVIQRVK